MEPFPSASLLYDELFWVIVGIAVALVIGVITIWITVRARPRRALAYETQATPVVANEAADRVTIVTRQERWRAAPIQ